MFLFSSQLYKKLMIFFFFIQSFLVIPALEVRSEKLFFPARDKSGLKRSKDKLEEIKISYDLAQGKVKQQYLEALVAEIDEKRAKADRLSMQAYKEYLLSLPQGDLIQKEGSAPYLLWNLLRDYPLSSEIVVFLQDSLELSLIEQKPLDDALLKDIIRHYKPFQESPYFCQLTEEINKIKSCVLKIPSLGVVVINDSYSRGSLDTDVKSTRLVDNNSSKNIFFEALSKIPGITNTRNTLYGFIREQSVLGMLKLDLVEQNADKNFSDEDLKKRVLVISRRYSNEQFYDNFLDIVAHTDHSNICDSSYENNVRIGSFMLSELNSIDLSNIDDSYMNERAITNIIVLSGHTSKGDYIEIVKFPKENKVFYRIEIDVKKRMAIKAINHGATKAAVCTSRGMTSVDNCSGQGAAKSCAAGPKVGPLRDIRDSEQQNLNFDEKDDCLELSVRSNN